VSTRPSPLIQCSHQAINWVSRSPPEQDNREQRRREQYSHDLATVTRTTLKQSIRRARMHHALELEERVGGRGGYTALTLSKRFPSANGSLGFIKATFTPSRFGCKALL
jgi:hypothetical protein